MSGPTTRSSGRRARALSAEPLAVLLAFKPDRLAAAAQQKRAKLGELNAEIGRLERAIGAEASSSSASTSKDAQVTGGGSTGAWTISSTHAKKCNKNKPAADLASSTSASTPAPSTAAEAKENAAPVAEKGKDVKGKGKVQAVEVEGGASGGKGEEADRACSSSCPLRTP
ncbi:hypothetical protein JCM10213_002996 [Rhodosporidiobolus nylandii]